MENSGCARLLIDNATFVPLFIAVRARRTTVDIELYRRSPRRIAATEVQNGTQREIALDDLSLETLRKHGLDCLRIWDNTARFRFKWTEAVNAADGTILVRLTPEVLTGGAPRTVYDELHLQNFAFGDVYAAISAPRTKVRIMLYRRQPDSIETVSVPHGATLIMKLSGRPKEILSRWGSPCLALLPHPDINRIRWDFGDDKDDGIIIVRLTPEVSEKEPPS